MVIGTEGAPSHQEKEGGIIKKMGEWMICFWGAMASFIFISPTSPQAEMSRCWACADDKIYVARTEHEDLSTYALRI